MAVTEQPPHEVTVQAFELARTETTVRQYRACVDDGACTPPAIGELGCNYNGAGSEMQPVNCVTWQQAGDFCEWAQGRLPSEAEWEYAARSTGKDVVYPWGDAEADCDLAVFDNGTPGCGKNVVDQVCSRATSNTDQGLSDLAGNVSEWVQDWYHASYHGAPGDGTAWELPEGLSRVRRGGGLFDSGSRIAVTARDYEPSSQQHYEGIGFRFAR